MGLPNFQGSFTVSVDDNEIELTGTNGATPLSDFDYMQLLVSVEMRKSESVKWCTLWFRGISGHN